MYIKYLFGEIKMKKLISVVVCGILLAGCCCPPPHHDVTSKIHHEHGCK